MENNVLMEIVKKLQAEGVIAVNIPTNKVIQATIDIIKELHAMGYEGVMIALSKDYQELARIFSGAGVDMGKLHIIDGVSRMYGTGEVDLPNVHYMENLQTNTYNLDIIKEVIRSSKKDSKRFVLLDSLTVLLMYNQFDDVMVFCKEIVDITREAGCLGIVSVVYLGSPNQRVENALSWMTDEIIDTDKEFM